MRVLLTCGAALLLAACGAEPAETPAPGLATDEAPATTMSAPDGEWVVTSIDGEPVEPGEFLLTTANGAISGGYDGCNSWGRVPGQPGMIEQTAQGCGISPLMDAYGTVALNDNARLVYSGDALTVTAVGKELTARQVGAGEAIEPRIASDMAPVTGEPPVRPAPPSAP